VLNPKERKNIIWRVGTLLCLGLVFLIGHARAQTTPDLRAQGVNHAAFTAVVIEDVTIHGAGGLGADEGAKLVESLKGEAYTDTWLKKLTDKVTRRLEDDGFLGATVKTTVRSLNSTDGRQHFGVLVDIDAGSHYTISQILWTGSSVFTTKQLDDMILLRPGGVARLNAIGESQMLLDKVYAERGYPAAIVTIMFQKYADVGKVDLYGEIQEGEKSSGGKVASEKNVECTTPTMEEIRKAPFTPGAGPYDPKVDAQLDIERAKLEAERTNRNVLLIAGGDWCGWCHMLEQTFQLSVPTRELRDRNFVVVHVNISEQNDNSCALRPYPKATGYPFVYVTNADGKLLATSDTRDWESAYGYNPTKIEDFLKKW
jgi:hypothetical protein